MSLIQESMEMHYLKIKEYENYLNYLHSSSINNSMNVHNNTFHAAPPTSVNLAFSDFASPPTNPVWHSHHPLHHCSIAPMHQCTIAPFHAPIAPPIASPPTNPVWHSHQEYNKNIFVTPSANFYEGNEFNIWGPGQLGLFAKTPEQLGALLNRSHPSLEHKTIPEWKGKLEPIQMYDAARLHDSCISSPKSSIPPRFKSKGSPSIGKRDKLFIVNQCNHV